MQLLSKASRRQCPAHVLGQAVVQQLEVGYKLYKSIDIDEGVRNAMASNRWPSTSIAFRRFWYAPAHSSKRHTISSVEFSFLQLTRFVDAKSGNQVSEIFVLRLHCHKGKRLQSVWDIFFIPPDAILLQLQYQRAASSQDLRCDAYGNNPGTHIRSYRRWAPCKICQSVL